MNIRGTLYPKDSFDRKITIVQAYGANEAIRYGLASDHKKVVKIYFRLIQKR